MTWSWRSLFASVSVWLCMGLTQSYDPLYTSLDGMRQLQSLMPHYASVIQNYIQHYQLQHSEQIHILTSQLLEEVKPEGLLDIENPIGSYKLVQLWGAVEVLIKSQPYAMTDLRQQLSEADIPEYYEVEHKGCAMGILRLQRTYNLPTSEVAMGIMAGSQAMSLTFEDMEYIGLLASEVRDYGLAAEWLEQARQRASTALDASRIHFKLAETCYYIGDYDKAVLHIINSQHFDPHNDTIKSHAAMYGRVQAEVLEQPDMYPPRNTLEGWQRQGVRRTYESLCRGENTMDVVKNSKLMCRYRKTNNPYAPAKEEVLNFEPRLMILHDVISDSDIEWLKNKARPGLRRAGIGDPKNPSLTNDRVGEYSWLWDFQDATVNKLSDLVQLYTGLSTEFKHVLSDAEGLQIMNYGLGGQYEPHHDFYTDESQIGNMPDFIKGNGDRVATFMFYLSDVKKGGATVFPNLNVHIPAVKGAAAFWYNIKRSGEKDTLTLHAGCPVLLGEKWVANKWIHHFGQWKRRPCGMTPTASDL